MTPLQIQPRNHHDFPEQRDGRLIVRGERRWKISGDPEWVVKAADVLGRLVEEQIAGILLINFGNTVGRITVPGLGMLEIVSGKWDEAHFEQMLADIAHVATGLPFTIDQPTGFPYDRSVISRKDVRYHLFVYLRHILSPVAPRDEQLLPALQTIIRQPQQRFDLQRHEVRFASASRIDSRSLVHIAAGMGGIARAEGAAARTPLARVLHGNLPRTVDERQITHCVDTPENRFVKSFMQFALGIIAHMRASLGDLPGGKDFRARIQADCDQMEQRLRPVAQHRIWAEVGPMIHLPAGSTVLQGRRGYREVYRAFVRLRLATHIPLDPDTLRDLLEARDIARLYELWTYFTMARLLETLLGRPQQAVSAAAGRWQYQMKQKCEVRWAGNIRLRYNPTYPRGSGLGRSYSVQLRPDIALHIGGTPQIHLFDAKFRLDPTTALPQEDADADADVATAEERRGTFKKADLYKMHTYRDALHATSVWILYPGTESRFFTTTGTRLDLPGETIPVPLDGVGALALRPEPSGDTVLCTVLQSLLPHA